MANGNRVNASDARRAPVLRRGALSSDPTLPRTLVSLVYATGDLGQARGQRPPDASAAERRRPLPRRLPTAIAAEMAPNILYRRYPLVTSLLVELDELRRVGVLPPTRRGR